MASSISTGDRCLLPASHLSDLVQILAEQNYRVTGPVVRNGTIALDQLSTADALPTGWTDTQESASYRLEKTDSHEIFGFRPGAQSWKKFLFPPVVKMWSVKKTRRGFEQPPQDDDEGPFAFIGVRPCELDAIAIQDRVFLEGQYPDPSYKKRREGSFIVAVNCTNPGNTCFCTSMDSGPRASTGYDLAMTEVIEGDEHFFVVDVGSDAGAKMIGKCHIRECPVEKAALGDGRVKEAAGRMGRSLSVTGLKDRLQNGSKSSHWNVVAKRCLACSNCTMVCPTCFCSAVEDDTDLSGKEATRHRRWDSCFNGDFSYMHGGPVRSSIGSRYRQWLTHKLAHWHDQFGTSGCVGCGRCITWCPAAIDITEEAAAIKMDTVPEQ